MMRIIFSLGVVQVVTIAIALFRSKVLAMLLGKSGFGVLGAIDQLVMSIALLSNIGLPFTALKIMSRSHSIGKAEFKRAYLSFFDAIGVVATVATLIAI